ncbi:MAG TPA: signal peptidase I, partial [Vicinamibacteria bacterium]|nr:signal peptidase I [Vicinamibacteria bacterium]
EQSLAREPELTLLPPRDASRSQIWRALWELVHDLSVAVLFCFFLITFVAQAFRVQGTSMLPLLADSERIIVNKFVYRFRHIDRGDVVVFWYPKDPSVSFIKRVIGVPGDTVELRRGDLLLNGQRVREEYVLAAFRDDESHDAVVVPRGYYYVLGDHRSSSNDSRSWGEVPEKYIYGKAFFRFWPLSKVGLIR